MMQPAAPERIQKGMAYFAHAARSDEHMVEAAAEELGSWEEAALTFAACSRELLAQLALQLDIDEAALSQHLAVRAAQIQAEGAAPQ